MCLEGSVCSIVRPALGAAPDQFLIRKNGEERARGEREEPQKEGRIAWIKRCI